MFFAPYFDLYSRGYTDGVGSRKWGLIPCCSCKHLSICQYLSELCNYNFIQKNEITEVTKGVIGIYFLL